MHPALATSLIAASFAIILLLMLGLARRLRKAETNISRLKEWRHRHTEEDIERYEEDIAAKWDHDARIQ